MYRLLERTQDLAAPLDRVWDFFATPANLNELTPPDLRFVILGEPGPMRAGQLIRYHIRVAPLVRIHWLTEIRHVVPGSSFVDEQRSGPYAFWYHEHHFASIPGGVRMTDRVTYALPAGPLGDLVHAAWVGAKLRHIFDYRDRRAGEIFGRLSSDR